MVVAVVADPGVAEDLVAEALFITGDLRIKGIPRGRRVRRDLERVRRCPQPDHRSAAGEVVAQVRHLLGRRVEEAGEDHQQVRLLEHLQPGKIRGSRFDMAAAVDAENHRALEAVRLRQDPRQRRAGLLGAVLVVGRDEHDVLPLPRTTAARIGDRRGGQDGKQRQERQQDANELHQSRNKGKPRAFGNPNPPARPPGGK